jgi:tetratricopeptide (TPR) repeat protein
MLPAAFWETRAAFASVRAYARSHQRMERPFISSQLNQSKMRSTVIADRMVTMPPARQSRTLTMRIGRLALVCSLVLVFLNGCAPESPPFESVEVPQDLAEMDRAVRLQFEQLWHQGSDTSTPAAERGNWGVLAQWFHVYRYPDSAVRSYTNAMLVEPDEPRWPYMKALLLAEQGDTAKARTLFQAALTLAPEIAPIHVQLGDLARSAGDLETAEAHYKQALVLRPTDAGARFGLGQLALLRGDAAAALQWLEPLSEEQPDAAELNYVLATALRLNGDIEGAQVLLARVPEENLHQTGLRRFDPWWNELMQIEQGSREVSRRAVQAARRGEDQRAAVLFGIAVQRDPNGPEERLNWALSLSRLGHHEQAWEQIQEAIARAQPGSDMQARARTEAARLATVAGRPRQAQTMLEALLSEQPELAQARVQLGGLLHSLGDLHGALEQYQALRDADAFNAEVAFWQAAALLALGQRDRVADQLVIDRRNYPEVARLRQLHWRLIATQPVANPQRLWALLHEANQSLQDPPKLMEAETLAMIYAALDEYSAAIAWQQVVMETLSAEPEAGPSQIQIARRRLTLYQENKRPSRAWEASEQAIAIPVRSPYPDLLFSTELTQP